MKALPELNLEPTLAQQFELVKIEKEMENLSREQLRDLLLQVSRLLMMKDNVIRSLLRQ